MSQEEEKDVNEDIEEIKTSPQEEEIEEEQEKQEEEVEEEKEEEKEPNPVEGETPRERALRKEVENLRKKNRDLRGEELFDKKEPEKKVEVSKILEKYKKEDLDSFKEVFEAMADEYGFVKKDEFQKTTYEQSADTILNSFLEKHQEYLPENDKDNVLWNSFKDEFSLYKRPENPRDLLKLFNKVHNSISGSKIDRESIAAKNEKIKQAAHGGTTIPKTHSYKESSVDPSVKSHLKGFTDEELNDLYGI